VFHGLLWNLLLTWPPNMSFADLAHIALGQALLHAVALQKAVPTCCTTDSNKKALAGKRISNDSS